MSHCSREAITYRSNLFLQASCRDDAHRHTLCCCLVPPTVPTPPPTSCDSHVTQKGAPDPGFCSHPKMTFATKHFQFALLRTPTTLLFWCLVPPTSQLCFAILICFASIIIVMLCNCDMRCSIRRHVVFAIQHSDSQQYSGGHPL